MVTLGTIKVANITQYEREGMVTVVMPLDKEALNIPIGDVPLPDVTAIDPLDDLVDRKVQWYPIGPQYEITKKYRNIRLQFPVKMPAGLLAAHATRISNGWQDYPYTHYYERDIVITDDVGTTTAFVIHSEVAKALPNTGTTMTFDFGAEITHPRLRFDVEFDLLAGSLRGGFNVNPNPPPAYVRRLGIRNAAIQIDVPDDQANANMLSYQVRSRIDPFLYPNLNGNKSQANFHCTFMYEIWSGMPYVPFWFYYGDSFITRDVGINTTSPATSSLFRNSNRYHPLAGPVDLRVTSPEAHTVVPRYELVKVPGVSVDGDTTTIKLIEPNDDHSAATHASTISSITTNTNNIGAIGNGTTIAVPSFPLILEAGSPIHITISGVAVPPGAPEINGTHYFCEQIVTPNPSPPPTSFFNSFAIRLDTRSVTGTYTGGSVVIKHRHVAAGFNFRFDRNRYLFSNGNAQVIEGVILFEGGSPSALELSTFDAEKDQSGAAPLLAMSVDWGDVSNRPSYGPFGTVAERPGNGNIPSNSRVFSDATAFRWACQKAHDEYAEFENNNNKHSQRDPWTLTLHGVQATSNITGANLFNTTLWHLARTGCPDHRAVTISMYQEFIRARHFYEESVEPFNPSDHTDRVNGNPAPADLVSTVVYDAETPFFSGGSSSNMGPWLGGFFGDRLGKNSRTDGTSYPNNNPFVHNQGTVPWSVLDKDHTSVNGACFAIQLTGNRFGLFGLIPHLIASCLCMRPNVTKAIWEKFRGTKNAIFDYTAARGEARFNRMLTHVYSVSGDPRLINRMEGRLDWLLGRTPEYLGEKGGGTGSGITLSAETVLMSFDTPPTIAGGQLAFGNISGLTSSWTHWMEGLNPAAWYSIYKMLLLKDSPTAQIAAAEYLDILYRSSEKNVLGGYGSPTATGTSSWKILPYIHWAWNINPVTKQGVWGKRLSENNQPGAYRRQSPGSNLSLINPITGEIYVLYNVDGVGDWICPEALLAFEYAQLTGNSTLATKAKDIIDDLMGDYFSPDRWGWEGHTGLIDYSSVMPNQFKTRSVSSKTAVVTMIGTGTVTTASHYHKDMGMQGTGSMVIAAVKVANVHHVSADIAGTGILTSNFPVGDPPAPTPKITSTITADPITFQGEGEVVATARKILGPTVHEATVSMEGSATINVLYTRLGTTFINTVKLQGVLQTKRIIKVREPMPKEDVNFPLYAGNHLELEVNISDENGDDLNITGAAQIEWLMQRSVSDPSDRVFKNVGNGITMGAAINQFLVEILPDDTQGLDGPFYHEAEIELSGKDTTVLVGSIDVRPVAID